MESSDNNKATATNGVSINSAAVAATRLCISSLLSRASHDNRAFRTGSELCPGKRASEWRTGDFAKCGHVRMLRIRLARLAAELQAAANTCAIPKEECNSDDADEAAQHGHLEAIRQLRAYHSHCTQNGANNAATLGHLDVIRDLRDHEIHCTADGALFAAWNGYLEVVRDLREHGIHCNIQAADAAAMNGHLEVVQDLRAHGVHCTLTGVDQAAANGHLEVVRYLRARDIHCMSWAADWAAGCGHLHVIRDLRAHSVHCSWRGADAAARRGRLEVIRDLRENGIHCTFAGADVAAASGHLEVVRDLRAHVSIVPLLEQMVQLQTGTWKSCEIWKPMALMTSARMRTRTATTQTKRLVAVETESIIKSVHDNRNR